METVWDVAAAAQRVPRINPGDTAWVLASAALVLFMTPGLALFYGGMVRAKNVLGMLMQNFFCMGLISVIWAALTYSLAFSGDNKWIGNLDLAWLRDAAATSPTGFELSIPPLTFLAFQLMFAIITPALITGAVADRMKFSAWVWFIGLWAVLVYAPIAHWVFSPAGWLFKRGALDFAGGTVVHINAGIAALAAVILLGKRKGWPNHPMPPHALPFTLHRRRHPVVRLVRFQRRIGAQGRRHRRPGAGEHAHGGGGGDARLARCRAPAHRPRDHARRLRPAWSPGWWRSRRAPASSAAWRRSTSGLIAGAVCCFAVSLKFKFGYDDSLDVVGVHLVGGLVGSLLLGFFADAAINPAGTDGVFLGGGFGLFGEQVLAVVATMVWSFVVTFGIVFVLSKVLPGGIRVSEEDEETGLDLTQHSETGYALERV